MGVYEAFDEYQKTVDADPAHVKLARERRDIFVGALVKADGVKEIVKSGSLERRTQLEPIHDVDLIMVFDGSAVPEWGGPGPSSNEALERAHDEVVARLGLSRGTDSKLVRRADTRDHAVKCFVDPPDDERPFTVDVMPVVRQTDNTLLIPSTKAKEWSTADPEYLIDQVRRYHEDWSFFRPMVRVLKNWRTSVNSETRIKSLVMEVLALQCLPHVGNRPEALREFFTAAAVQVNLGVDDPAGHCGAIQPDLDIVALRGALLEAADLADRACDQAARNDVDGAQRTWQELFGPAFPAPPEEDSSQGSSCSDSPDYGFSAGLRGEFVQSVSGDDRFEWWHHEPGRLDADRSQLSEFFPGLTWSAHENGQWAGQLPMWPFDRDLPKGLDELLGGRGLEVLVRCGQSYPAAPPRIVPLDPQPQIAERTQQRWHVNGDGTLCLFQSEAVWTPRATLVDVLLKAAGWRIEYALMKTGLIDTMTINGIVIDDTLDATINIFSVQCGA